MKKILSYVLLLYYFFGSIISVSALNYDTYILIPADTPATVKTEIFEYTDFTYHSTPNERGNCSVEFQSITNLTQFKKPISINILLFDANRVNIGFLTYCTDKDVSSDYNGFKLLPGQASPFVINVTPRYMVEGKAPADVRYIAVMDENDYCQIGGYSKYEGLTIQEIYGGSVVPEHKPGYHFRDILKYFRDADLQVIVVTAAIVFFIAITFGVVINLFHKKLFLKYSPWAYVPIANAYIAAKMLCGTVIAKYFVGYTIISVILFFFNFNFFIMVDLVVLLFMFLVIAFKLITKRYETLYYDPRIAMQKPTDQSYSMSDYYSNLDASGNFDGSNIANDYLDHNSRDKVSSNLAYSNQEIQNDFNFGEDDVRAGDDAFQFDESIRNQSQINDEGESDLSNLFK